ncbi:hypothetical protein [Geotalea sp. SG265]|uniref:hypothetical protein n=1 Tax=Geotalea sp. SG265 TaxID=2922867 RepID=UPI001FAF5FC1|nr:hypothetical protein [Geotalea sp. SG265]
MQKGEQRVISLLPKVRVREVTATEAARFDPEFCSSPISILWRIITGCATRLCRMERCSFAAAAGDGLTLRDFFDAKKASSVRRVLFCR